MKRILSILLAFTLLFTAGVFASAAGEPGPGDGSQQELPSEEFIRNYALSFMQDSRPSANISIDEFLPLYALDERTITGYYVTYKNSGVREGYALLSFLKGGCPVVEFAFEGNGLIADSGAPSQPAPPEGAPDDPSAGEPKLIFGGADALFVPSGDEYYSVYYQEPASKEEVENACTPPVSTRASGGDIMGGIINWLDAAVMEDSVFKIQNFGAGTDYFLTTDFRNSKINCVPTAATNVLWYWGAKRGSPSIKTIWNSTDRDTCGDITFDALYAGMKTGDSLISPDGTDVGRTLDGFISFFGTHPSSPTVPSNWSAKTLSPYASDPSEKFNMPNCVAALHNDCPMVLHLDIVEEPGEAKKSGHAVFNFGYAFSQNGAEYLFVMDGVNPYGRFVGMKYYDVMIGHKIWVAN